MAAVLLYTFALLTTVALVSCGDVLEKATNTKFPSQSKSGLSLVGVGVRVKQIGPIAAKVYSLGIYGQKNAIASKCKAMKCKSSKELLAHKSFSDLFASGDIVLKMVRSVKVETFTEALSGAIKPRMGGKDMDAVVKFSKIFTDALPNEITKNTEVKLTCSGGGVDVTINGKNSGSVSSAILSKAMIQTYTDKNAVSPSLREDVSKNVINW